MTDTSNPEEFPGGPPTIAELQRRIEKGRTGLEQILSGLTDEEMTTSGADGGWSVKDHLIHLAAWERGIAALLQGHSRAQAMEVDEAAMHNDTDSINATVHGHHQNDSLTDARTTLQQAQQQMSDAIASLTDADLMRPYSYYEPGDDNDTPIIGYIVGNTFGHYEEHQEWIADLVEQVRQNAKNA